MKKLYFSIILFFLCLSGFSQEWRQIHDVNSFYGDSYNSIKMVSKSVGYLNTDTNRSMPIMTINGGETWTDSFYDGIPFIVDSNNWCFFNGHNFSNTNDGGLSWILPLFTLYSFNIDGFYPGMYFTSADTGFMTYYTSYPSRSFFIRTTNNCLAWDDFAFNKPASDFMINPKITFLNSKVGFGIFNMYEITDSIQKYRISNDSVYVISIQIDPVPAAYNDLQFDNNTGYLCSSRGKIFRSLDIGETWNVIFSDTSIVLNALCFKNNIGYAVGNYKGNIIDNHFGYPVVCKTFDGGATWQRETLNYSSVLQGVSFVDSNTIFVCGTNKLILKGEKYNALKGSAFNDLNNNNIYDVGEPPLSGIVVKSVSGIQDKTFYDFSQSNGDFRIVADSGNYVLAVESYPQYISGYYPLNYTGHFPGLTGVDSNKNFAFHYIPHVKDLEVVITPITMTRPGFDVSYNITCRNVGVDTMSGYISLNYDNHLNYLNSVPAHTSVASNEIIWNYNNLLPGHYRSITANFNLPPYIVIGDSLINEVVAYPLAQDTTPLNNRDSSFQIITGSFDPNEKTVSPSSKIKSQNISDGQWLTYTLHFQNTGTDTAFNIKVADELNQNLLLSTVSVLSSSYPCNLTVRGSRTLEFTFSNIKLPDSNVNRIGSNGFVKFKVKIDANFQEGDTICNTAYIYFDYNLPVATNTVKTYIDNYSGIRTTKSPAKETMSIYPNPTNSSTNIEYNLNQSSKVNLSVYNFMGALVTNVCNEQQPAGNYKKTFNAKEFGLSAGIYFVRLSVNGKSEVRKILIIDGSI